MMCSYFTDVNFKIRDQRGNVSARISLRRGFRQGDPISPLMGSIIPEFLSRLIDHQGLGFTGEDGAQHSPLLCRRSNMCSLGCRGDATLP